MKILILGVGNLLLTDEGVGIHAVQTLLQNYCFPEEVEIIDGGTIGMELLAVLTGVDHLILLDAVTTGKSPGTIIRLDNDQIPALFRTKLSPHQIGLADILAALFLTEESPPHLTLFGVEPASLVLGIELSPQVAPQLSQLIQLVVEELKKLDVSLAPKEILTHLTPSP